MNLLIKNRRMPKTCSNCFAYDEDYKECRLYSYGIVSRYPVQPYDKPEWCELVKFSSHGQLIDVNTAIILLQDYYNREKDILKQHAIGECIMIIKDDVPTVIEAEE